MKSFAVKIKTRLETERGQAMVNFPPVLSIRIAEGLLMALLAGVLLAMVAEPVGLIAFVVGTIGFLVLMLRSDGKKVHFRFGVIFGVEWFLLPLAVAVSRHGTDASLWGLSVGTWLALSIPLSVIMGLFFLLVAVLFFRE